MRKFSPADPILRKPTTYFLSLPRLPATFALAEASARHLGLGFSLIVVAGGCWLLAGLFWGFTSPLPRPALPRDTQPVPVAERLAARSLFAGTPATARSAETTDGWRLIGVSASGDTRTARAIIRREGQLPPLVLAIGDELGSGNRLLRIEPDQVVLGNAGRKTVLALPRPTQPDTSLRQPEHD